MAEHELKVDVTQTRLGPDKAAMSDTAVRGYNNQLAAASRTLAGLNRRMGAGFRIVDTLLNQFGGINLAASGSVAALALLGKGVMSVVDHFKQAADILATTINDLQGFQSQAMATRARRMLEGGVTDAERNEAMIRMRDAEFRRKNLEDLQMYTARKAAKYPNADRAAAEVISRFMKSGLYSDEQINELVDKDGKFSLKALTDDLQKRISSALTEESQWRKVAEWTDKEPKQQQFDTKSVNFMDRMSKMGLYMSGGFAAGQGNVEVQVLREQKDILKKIEKNTADKTATYS